MVCDFGLFGVAQRQDGTHKDERTKTKLAQGMGQEYVEVSYFKKKFQ